MKSVRFDPKLEERLIEAARALSTSQSEFIREAVSKRCDEVLGDTLAARLQGLVGVIDSEGSHAKDAGKAFAKALVRRRRR